MVLIAGLAGLPTMGTEDAMKQILAGWQQRTAEYKAAIQQAPNDDERAAIPAPAAQDIAPALWASISGKTGVREEVLPRSRREKNKGAKPRTRKIATFEYEQAWALPAINWILQYPAAFASAFTEEQQAQLNYFSRDIIDSLSRVHFTHPDMAETCVHLSGTAGVREYEILQKVYQRNSSRSARACAALGMSLMLNNPLVSGLEGSEAMARGKRLYYLKQSLLLAEKDTKFGTLPLTDVAMEQAYYLRHLAKGCIAPQIQVKDVNGQQATLPQKGKATLLLFWAPGESASVAMMQDYTRLCEEYPEVHICPIIPFASPEEIAQELQNCGVSATYIDNESGEAGQSYRIRQVPTAILIGKDAGIIHSGAPDIQLQAALDALADSSRNADKAARPKILIREKNNAPEPPPDSETKAPDAAAGESVPKLREMPEF